MPGRDNLLALLKVRGRTYAGISCSTDSQFAEHLLRVRQEIFRQLVMFRFLKRSQASAVFVYVVDVGFRLSHQ